MPLCPSPCFIMDEVALRKVVLSGIQWLNGLLSHLLLGVSEGKGSDKRRTIILLTEIGFMGNEFGAPRHLQIDTPSRS